MQPRELVVEGLEVELGEGLDAFQSFVNRLMLHLPQVPSHPDDVDQLPTASYYTVRLVNTKVEQKASPGSEHTSSGTWPLRMSVPFAEVNSLQGLTVLPSRLRAMLSSDEHFNSQRWWRSASVARDDDIDTIGVQE